MTESRSVRSEDSTDEPAHPAELTWLDQCDRLRDSDTEEVAEFAELVYEVFAE